MTSFDPNFVPDELYAVREPLPTHERTQLDDHELARLCAWYAEHIRGGRAPAVQDGYMLEFRPVLMAAEAAAHAALAKRARGSPETVWLLTRMAVHKMLQTYQKLPLCIGFSGEFMLDRQPFVFALRTAELAPWNRVLTPAELKAVAPWYRPPSHMTGSRTLWQRVRQLLPG